MYNNILNPLTGRKVDIKSRLGKKILKTYLLQTDSQKGGISFKNRGDKFLEHIGTQEGYNELIACVSCSLNVLGLPINIVNRMSQVTAIDYGVSWEEVNKALNEVKDQSHPSSSWFPPTEIYIWGMVERTPPGHWAANAELSVVRYDKLTESDELFSKWNFINKKKKKKNKRHRKYENLPFHSFYTEGSVKLGYGYLEYIEKALHNIFNSLNNGSSTLLGIIWAGGGAHAVVISKSTRGTPYLIDAQSSPSHQGLENGFAQGWAAIHEYFDQIDWVDYLLTFNNSQWKTNKDGNFVLTNPEFELNIETDFYMPRNTQDDSLQDLNPERNTVHPSRIESYTGTSLPSAVEWPVEARAKAKAVKEAETEGLAKAIDVNYIQQTFHHI